MAKRFAVALAATLLFAGLHAVFADARALRALADGPRTFYSAETKSLSAAPKESEVRSRSATPSLRLSTEGTDAPLGVSAVAAVAAAPLDRTRATGDATIDRRPGRRIALPRAPPARCPAASAGVPLPA